VFESVQIVLFVTGYVFLYHLAQKYIQIVISKLPSAQIRKSDQLICWHDYVYFCNIWAFAWTDEYNCICLFAVIWGVCVEFKVEKVSSSIKNEEDQLLYVFKMIIVQ